MMHLRILFILCVATLVCSQNNFDVTNFGAVGDEISDDSQAFVKAWKAVCGAKNNPTLIIPRNKTFLLNRIKFEGPCKSDVQIQIDGNIVAPKNSVSKWKGNELKWLSFRDVNGLNISGNGQLDAQGSNWWKKHCEDKNGCKNRPTTLAFVGCSNFQVKGLTSINSGKNHISVSNCERGSFSSLSIVAPKESPNTDGIDISTSTDIQIVNTTIATGDDCIAINHGSSRIIIIGVTCGPGHGISIGSLGAHGEKEVVENILVRNCTFNRTQNGARIKTWQGGRGYARNITYEDIIIYNSSNPIVIDQYYCPHKKCKNKRSDVQISDVSYINIEGTSHEENAINFSCSQIIGCTNILVQNVYITSVLESKKTYSFCINAHGKSSFSVPALDCMQT